MTCLTVNGVWYCVSNTMILGLAFQRLTAVLALVICVNSARAIVCNLELETVSGEDVSTLKRTSDGLTHAVLGDFDSRAYVESPLEAKVIFTNWKRQANHYVLNLRGSPKIRADVYEAFAKEISRRAELLKLNSGIEVEWDYTRVRLPDGTELFYGSKGYYFEVKPFNRCYGGKFKTAPTTPGWKPPYDDKGNPITTEFKDRSFLDPAQAPSLMFDSSPRISN